MRPLDVSASVDSASSATPLLLYYWFQILKESEKRLLLFTAQSLDGTISRHTMVSTCYIMKADISVTCLPYNTSRSTDKPAKTVLKSQFSISSLVFKLIILQRIKE